MSMTDVNQSLGVLRSGPLSVSGEVSPDPWFQLTKKRMMPATTRTRIGNPTCGVRIFHISLIENHKKTYRDSKEQLADNLGTHFVRQNACRSVEDPPGNDQGEKRL
jgi:hypothetical protein